MALSTTGRGSGNASASVTTWNISPGSNCTAGATLVLSINYDNAATNGADPFSSISDSAGNTWTLRDNELNDPGAANEGVALRVYTTAQNAGTLTTGSTITVSFSTGTTARAYTLTEVTASAGSVTFASASGATGTSSTPSITTGTMASGELVVGCLGSEGGAPTADSDTTNGSWSTMVDSGTGGGAAGQHATTQNKVVTGSGTQTWNPTLSNSRDWCIAVLIFQETSTTRTATTSLSGGSTTIAATASFSPGTKTATAALSGKSTTISASTTFTSRLRHTDRAASSDTTSGTSIAISPGSNCTAGATVWLAVCYDNAGTNGADPFSSISDTNGNTWTLRQNGLNDPGAANEGVALRLYTTRQTGGTLTTSSTITVSFSASVGAATWLMGEVASSWPVGVAESGMENDGNTLAPSITTGTLQLNDILVGVCGYENNATNNTYIADADSTNGLWSSATGVDTGLGANNLSVYRQVKAVTGSGSQTFNPIIGEFSAQCDSLIGYLVFREAPYAATASLSGGSTTIAATATFTGGPSTATAAMTTGSTSLSASVAVSNPAYTASASLSGGSTTLVATGTFSESKTATVTLTGGSTVLAAVMDVTNPTYSATAVLTTGSTTLSASILFTRPRGALIAEFYSTPRYRFAVDSRPRQQLAFRNTPQR